MVAHNPSARPVCSGRKYDHVTPLLHELDWLPFPERITFRLAVLAIGANMVWHRHIWSSPRHGCWLSSKTSIHIDGSAARSTHETLDSWWPSCRSCRCSHLEQSTTQCHFGALSVYFQKETQNRTLFSPFFALTVYMRMRVLFCMPLTYVYFPFKRLCGPPYGACIVPLKLTIAYVTVN